MRVKFYHSRPFSSDEKVWLATLIQEKGSELGRQIRQVRVNREWVYFDVKNELRS